MASSTSKKALIRRYDRETLAGYVNPASFVQPEGVELISEDGRISLVPFGEITHAGLVFVLKSQCQQVTGKFP